VGVYCIHDMQQVLTIMVMPARAIVLFVNFIPATVDKYLVGIVLSSCFNK
jgi:hypothetical protein